MSKVIDLKRSVYELTKDYPELIGIMKGLGFTEITKPFKMNTVGRLMTIPKGAKMMNIDMNVIVRTFEENGFEVLGNTATTKNESAPAVNAEQASSDKPLSRTEQLKGYLRRLGAREDMESVRADFVREFGDVEASEIMQAEQELIKEGTPLHEVQRLCDVHSALFHGATREEKIANAEKAVEESLKKQKIKETITKRDSYPQKDYSNKIERAAELVEITGHPLRTLTKENDVLAALLEDIKPIVSEKGDVTELLLKVRELSIHYAKKGDLLYPLLKVKYGVSGPSDVMWTVDDEIRDEIGALSKEENRNDEWFERLSKVLSRAEEMIYKEKNILFPICAVNFTEEEWQGIYRDQKDYSACFGVESGVWQAAENVPAFKPNKVSDEIVMPGGHMTVEQLTALLNTIPLEITFVDGNNINRYFNESPKVFKRPSMAIDREVFSCHPPKVEVMVRQIIDDFREGRLDSVPVWMEKNGRTVLVTYMAVRDKEKRYLGTVELVQDMEFAKRYFVK